MMHSNDYPNYHPRQPRRSSLSNSTCCLQPRKAPRRRLSMTLSLEDGSTHDLTNLSYKAAQEEQLFPSCEYVRRLKDVPDHHTLQLWQPLPRAEPTFHRANTTTTCTRKEEEERTSRSSYNCTINHYNNNNNNNSHYQYPSPQPKPAVPRRPSHEDDEPVLAPPVRRQQEPRRTSMPAQQSFVPPPPPTPSTAPTTIPSVRREPGPRPKVNYKKLYGRGGAEEDDSGNEEMSNSSRNGMRGSRRRSHLSFQEQQLQRTLQEEERLCKQEEQSAPVPVEEPYEPSPRPPDMMPAYNDGWQQWPQEEQVMPPLMSMPQQQQPKTPQKQPEKPSYQAYHQEPAYTPSPQPPRSMPCAPPAPSSSGNSQTVMEIAPNLFVPYKGSHETWEAVQRGQFTVTTCFACTLQLVVIDTAEFLVCPDCHTVSPLSYSGDSHVERCGVGLGIKREWCDTEAALPQQQQEEPQRQFSTPPPMQPYPQHTTTSRPSYEQRHQEKQAKYHNERSPSPEQEDRYHHSNAQRRSTFML